jgi:hypothetical protein
MNARSRREAMIASSAFTAVLLLGAVTDCMAREDMTISPQILPITATGRWEAEWEGETRYWHFLTRGIVMPSREWIVFEVNRVIEPPRHTGHLGTSEVVALEAYHFASGRTFELTIPQLAGRRSWIQSLDPEPTVVALGKNRCGFVVVQPTAEVVDADREPSRSSLWQWDLDSHAVRVGGPWQFPMTRIARVLDSAHCQWTWDANMDDPWQGVLVVRDPYSFRTSSVDLRTSDAIFAIKMQTYSPTSDPRAFAVCDSWDSERLHVFCVDPNRPRGRRWELDREAIEAIVGRDIRGAAFPAGLSFPVRRIPLFVAVTRNGEASTALILLDSATGRVVERYHFALDSSHAFPFSIPLLSPDGKHLLRAVFNDDRYEVIDVATGAVRVTESKPEFVHGVRVWGFVDRTRAVVATDFVIWLLDVNSLEFREIFRLPSPNGP